MRSCLAGTDGHEACRSYQERRSDFKPPKRLIDVGEHPDYITRLVVSQEDYESDDALRYLILSYCWGSSNEGAKTTRGNYSQRRQHLDTACLPRTVRDAIKLTRLLGARYLWVDAVCIIQRHDADDYLIDWEEEAPKMGLYYSNAQCLIAATGASDSSQGLFAERPVHRYPTEACAVNTAASQSNFFLVPGPSMFYGAGYWGFGGAGLLIVGGGGTGDVRIPEPLLTRGWSVQEIASAPRILHWTTHALVWECRSIKEASEYAPITTGHPNANPGILELPASSALNEEWYNLLSRYYSMSLTYEADRFIAIEGLGTQLAQRHHDQYFFGLFRSSLDQGLCWYLKSYRSKEKRGPFPTWLWIAHSPEKWCEIGFIWLRGSYSLLTKPPVFPPVTSAAEFLDVSGRRLSLHLPILALDGDQIDDMDKFLAGKLLPGKKDVTWVTTHMDPGSGSVMLPGRIYLLFLGHGLDGVAGLVLKAVGEMYERIGVFEWHLILLLGPGKVRTDIMDPIDSCLQQYRRDVVLV